MKPAFALSLSYEGIALLHRAAGGWRSVGTVQPDDPELNERLVELRARAAVLDADLRCKVVIPNDQIRYMTVETGDADADTMQRMVVETLADATPYALDELAYDISVDGPITHLAAVATETLHEAEAFAVAHGFDPVSFVAIPSDNGYLGEPFFGPSEKAISDGHGHDVVADGISIVVVGAAELPTDPAQHSGDEIDLADQAAQDPDRREMPVVGFSSRRGKPDAAPKSAPEDPDLADATSPVAGGDEVTADITAPSIVEPDMEPAPPEDTPEPPPLPAAPAAPDMPDTPARDPQPHQIAGPSPATGFGGQTPVVLDESQRLTVFGARGAQPVEGLPTRQIGLVLALLVALALAAAAAWVMVIRDADLFGSAPSSEEPSGLVPAPRTVTAPTPPSSTEATVLLRTDPQPPEMHTDDLLAALPDPGVVPPLTDTDDAVLQALQEAPAPADPEPEAPAQPDPHPIAEPGDPPAVTDPRQLAQYAATGIWPDAPQEPETPGVIALDDLYLAAIDPNDLAQDPVALPPAVGYDTDGLPNVSDLPPRAGTTFDLDPRGLVKATPEGTRTPDGVMVYLGRPSKLPPPPPLRFREEPEIDADRSRLAEKRPRTRPGNLVEQTERTRLGGRSRTELATLRPRPRPESLQARAEAEDPEPVVLASAIATGPRPKPRPRDLDTTPRQSASLGSLADPDRAPTSEPDTFAAKAVQPRAPSSASVARQATLDNAINLRSVNLIGVYGTPRNRRALIRLPSGRYKKVKVGDRLDGGRVVAIGDSELRYQKGGRNRVLKIPSG